MKISLQKIIVCFLVFFLATNIFAEAQLWYFIFEAFDGTIGSVADNYSIIYLVVRLLIYTWTFVAVFKLVKLKRIELINAFKFPIFTSIILSMYWYLLLFLSRENSNHIFQLRTSLYVQVLFVLNIIFMMLVCIYFLGGVDKKEIGARVQVSSKARFINWLIDFSFITFFTISHFKYFHRELVLLNFFTERVSFNLLFLMNMFLYYFILELIFLQTIGKLHNNSFVKYTGNRFTSILSRTLCRFIPFEVFSWFGNKGWHDLISRTKVVVAKKDI